MSETEKPISDAQAEASAPPAEERIPVPPATLEFLMLSLRTQAELQLGLIHFGAEEDRPKPDFDLARHSIDLLGVLRDKTRGNLTLEEQRLLENSLTEFASASCRHSKKARKAEWARRAH